MYSEDKSFIVYQLHQLGISNCTLITSLIILVLLFLAFKVLSQFAIFSPVSFAQETLPKMRILYLSRTGNYDGSEAFHHEVKTTTGKVFKISKYIGIYYDDPLKTDPAKCRSIIGVIVNVGEHSKIQQFLKEHPNYNEVQTQPTKAFSFTLPYVNQLSLLVAQWKVYPELAKLTTVRDDVKFSPYVIEVYNSVPMFWGKWIQISKVIDHFEDFQLWKDGENKMG